MDIISITIKSIVRAYRPYVTFINNLSFNFIFNMIKTVIFSGPERREVAVILGDNS